MKWNLTVWVQAHVHNSWVQPYKLTRMRLIVNPSDIQTGIPFLRVHVWYLTIKHKMFYKYKCNYFHGHSKPSSAALLLFYFFLSLVSFLLLKWHSDIFLAFFKRAFEAKSYREAVTLTSTEIECFVVFLGFFFFLTVCRLSVSFWFSLLYMLRKGFVCYEISDLGLNFCLYTSMDLFSFSILSATNWL